MRLWQENRYLGITIGFIFLGAMGLVVGYYLIPQAPHIQEVILAQSQKGTLHKHWTGILLPQKQVQLSLDQPGRIAKIYVQDGETVSPGQVLATLDWTQEELNYRKKLQALRQLEQEEHRDGLSEEAVAHKVTLAEELKVLTDQIAKKTLIAPFGGQLGLWNAQELDYVTPEESLITLRDTAQWHVHFEIPQTLAQYVQLDQSIEIQVRDDLTIPAKIFFKSPEVSSHGQVLVRAVLAPVEIDAALLSGMQVQIAQSIPMPEGVWLPVQAVQMANQQNSPFIYVLEQGKHIRTQPVEIAWWGDQEVGLKPHHMSDHTWVVVPE